MDRTRGMILLVILGGLTLVSVGITMAGQGGMCDRCNIVLVSIDPLRADHLGTYGYQQNTSPNIDRVAAEGTVFRRAFTASSNTLPATFSMFTGLYPSQHVVTPSSPDGGFSDQFTLLAEVLQAHGYRTISVNGGENVRGELGFRRGFDSYREKMPLDQRAQFVGETVRSGESPFFLYYQTFNTHDPYIAPERYYGRFGPMSDLFRQETISMLENSSQAAAEQGLTGRERNEFVSDRYRDYYFGELAANETRRRHAIAGYDALVRETDAFLGQLFALLERSGRMEDTLIVVTSQHGEEFGEHGRWEHTQLYNEVMRVPLIIRVPGRQTASSDEYVELIDLGETLLDIVGATNKTYAKQGLGRSVAPLLQGDDIDPHPVLAERSGGRTAFIDAHTDIKYMRDGVTETVYNLSTGLEETEQVMNVSAIVQIRERFERFYAGLHGVRLNGTWPYFG